MADIWKPVWRLLAITVVAGLALGVTNALTADTIAKRTALEAEASRRDVLSSESYTEVDYTQYSQNDKYKDAFSSVYGIYAAETGGETIGYIVELTGSGFGGKLYVTVGVLNDGTITGVRITEHNETVGLDAKATKESFYSQYTGLSTLKEIEVGGTGGNSIDAISGATVTSKAVTKTVNQAGEIAAILSDRDPVSSATGNEEPEPDGNSSATQEKSDPESTSSATEED